MYDEQYRPWFFYLLVGILVIWAGWILYSISWFSDDSISAFERNLTIAGFILLGVYLAWITWAISLYKVRFDGENLAFGFLGWNTSFTRMGITSTKMVEISWFKWGGMGWRIKGLKKIGYITKNGPGIEIQTTRKGRSYTFNCADPQSLASHLEKVGVAGE